jgi:hypothetical protein
MTARRGGTRAERWCATAIGVTLLAAVATAVVPRSAGGRRVAGPAGSSLASAAPGDMVLSPASSSRVSTASLGAALLPILGTTSTTAPPPPPPTSTPERPPANASSFEAETLPGVSIVTDSGASGGQLARGLSVAGPAGVSAGVYRVTVRVRSLQTTRLDVQVAGGMIGSYGTGSTWRVVSAVGRVDDPTQLVGVSAAPGTTAPVDVDWVSLAPVESTYSVRGNRIVTPTGNPLRPRGVNVPGYHTDHTTTDGRLQFPAPQGPYVWAWGVDMVRLSVNQEQWLANCPSDVDGVTMSYRQALARDVADLTRRGILTLIVLSVVERNQATGCQLASQPLLKEMADLRSLELWRGIATEFASNPLVAFDLFNEPHDITPTVWRSGGDVTYTTSGLIPRRKTYRAVGMQSLYDTVRATGATNLVFVSGVNWATEPGVALGLPLDGYGIVLGTHVYCGTCTPWDPHLPSGIDSQNSPQVRSRFPLVVTEAGWQFSQDARYNRAVINWANNRDLGWLAFAFIHPGQYSLVSSWDATFPAGGGVMTKPPSLEGAPVWNSLADTRVARGLAPNPVPE